MDNVLRKLFPEQMQRRDEGRCPFCDRPITSFRSSLAAQEFEISGLCETCQNATFGKEDPAMAQEREAQEARASYALYQLATALNDPDLPVNSDTLVLLLRKLSDVLRLADADQSTNRPQSD